MSDKGGGSRKRIPDGYLSSNKVKEDETKLLQHTGIV